MLYKATNPPKLLQLLTCLALIFAATNASASEAEKTSTDIYCESMTLALYESLLNYQAPNTAEMKKRVEKSQSETLQACKAMPTIGATEKKVKDMTPQEIALIGCVGMAEGVFMAQADSSSKNFSYAELTKNRKFIASACVTNKKRFLGDLRKNGPKYVLNQNHQ